MKSNHDHPDPDFFSIFGRRPEEQDEAPGRVNLIGEHTDYNGGLVLPMAIPQKTHAEAAARQDDYVRVWTSALSGGLEYYQAGTEVRTGEWLDYVKGITYILRKEGFNIRGFDLRITSNVPLGSGLSSSAAFEIAVLRVLRRLFSLSIDDVKVAVLGQKVENDFVGANVGIMDQMAASLADEHTALKINTRTLEYEKIELPPEVEVVVINSGIKHSHAGGEYNLRRKECEDAARILDVEYLTDLTECDLEKAERLPAILQRRVRHVVTENARVGWAVEAMREHDAARLGKLFNASHVSLRDDYRVSIPEIDFLVEKAQGHRDIFGARMTGGGFGGSIVMLAKPGRGLTAANVIMDQYCAAYSHLPSVLLPLPELSLR